MKQRFFILMCAPLPLENLEDSSPSWLRPRFFQRIFSNIAFSLVPFSIIFVGVKWRYLSLASAILESFVLGIYLWLMEYTFSFGRLRNVIFLQKEARILAKHHIQLTLLILGCFIFVWLCAFASLSV